jgi:Na+/proline symporter
VIWTDAIQMSLYVGGALLCVIVLLSWTGLGGLGKAEEGGKLLLLDFHSNIVTNPYAAITAIGGGAIFAMASHGSDQLFPRFILDELPAGVSGLLIAGILAATMARCQPPSTRSRTRPWSTSCAAIPCCAVLRRCR